MGLYESTAVAEVEVLGDLTGSYCTSAGMTVSSGGVHDVRRNSLLSVGIFEENREPGFLLLRVQPAEYDSRKTKKSTPCFINSPSLIAWLISSSVLRCLLSISPRRVSLKPALRR